MNAVTTAPAATALKGEITVGQEVTLVRGDHKGKDGIVVGEYTGRSYPVEITVKGESRVVNATPGSIGPRAAAEEPAAEETAEALEIDFSEATVEKITEAPVEDAPVEEKEAKRGRHQRIEFDAEEVVQPAEIEKGEHEFQDEAKGIYPTPRHLGRGFIYHYNLGWRWHNTRDEAPEMADRSEIFAMGYEDRMNRAKKWQSAWFGADLDDEGDDSDD